MHLILVKIFFLLWMVIQLLWEALKWFSKAILAPFCIGAGLFGVLFHGSIIPYLSALLHGGIVVYTYINVALPLMESESTIWFDLLAIALQMAFLDCVHELLFTAKTKRMPKNDPPTMAKLQICCAASGIGAAVYYYAGVDGGRLANIVAHYDVLLLLLVVPRALFILLEIYAYICVYPKIRRTIKNGDFFLASGSEYYKRYVEMQEKKGLLISNLKTIHKEKKASQEKLANMYPKKTLEILAEKLMGNKEMIAERTNAEAELDSIEEKTAYISKTGYQAFSKNMEKILRESGSLSPRSFIEKKFTEKSKQWLPLGVEFFLIQAFTQAVVEGRIIDEDKSDSPLVNHAYRHTQSNVPIKVTYANEDPRLALDD